MRTTMLALAMALVAAPVLAQQHTRDYSDQLPDDLPPFAEADTNGDGMLDLEEAQAVGIPKEVFEAEDHNYDGLISEPTYKYALRRENP